MVRDPLHLVSQPLRQDVGQGLADDIRRGALAGYLRDIRTKRRGDLPDDLREIIYIDHYGNAISGLRAGRAMHGWSRPADCYSARGPSASGRGALVAGIVAVVIVVLTVVGIEAKGAAFGKRIDADRGIEMMELIT